MIFLMLQELMHLKVPLLLAHPHPTSPTPLPSHPALLFYPTLLPSSTLLLPFPAPLLPMIHPPAFHCHLSLVYLSVLDDPTPLTFVHTPALLQDRLQVDLWQALIVAGVLVE